MPQDAPPDSRETEHFYHDLRTPLTVAQARLQLLCRYLDRHPQAAQHRLLDDLTVIAAQLRQIRRRLDRAQQDGFPHR